MGKRKRLQKTQKPKAGRPLNDAGAAVVGSKARRAPKIGDASDRLVRLFTLTLGVTGLTLAGLWLLVGRTAKNETSDRIMVGGAIVAALVVGAAALLRRAKTKFPEGIAACAVIISAIGIAAIEHHEPVLDKKLWMGFGPYVLLLTIALIPVSLKLIAKNTWSLPWRVSLWALAVVTVILGVLSFFQANGSMIDAQHSEFVINEILAPAAGYTPYRDFVPQYQTFYAWIFAPVVILLGPAAAVSVIIVALSLLGIFAVALGFASVRRVWKNQSLPLLLLLFCPLVFLTQGYPREGFLGSIAALLSALPIRLFPGMALGYFAVPVIARIRAGQVHPARLAALGFGAALVAWNSQDFGLAAALAMFIVVVLMALRRPIVLLRAVSWLAAGFAPGLVSYPAAMLALGRPLRTDLVAWFVRQFGVGSYGAEPIQIPGPLLIVLPMILAMTSVGCYALVRGAGEKSVEATRESNDAAVTTAFFGIWSLLGIGYYLNRSYASGQMQILLLPISVGLIGAITLMHKSPMLAGASFRSPTRILMSLIVALPLAAIVLLPNPVREIQRLEGQSTAAAWPRPALSQALVDAAAAKEYAAKANMSLAYFGAGGNYLQLVTGIRSANVFNSPFDLIASPSATVLACTHLDSIDSRILLLSDEAIQAFWGPGNTLCGLYRIGAIPGVSRYHVAFRIVRPE